MAPVLVKSLNRLSREAVIDLALKWLQPNRTSTPYLLSNRRLFEADEEDYLHTPAKSIEALRTIYHQLKEESTHISKRDVIDRIVDGDWRRGLSLQQHAMTDFAYLEQNDTALRWSALRLVPLEAEEQKLPGDDESQPPTKRRKLSNHENNLKYPQVSAQAFVSALKEEISPLVKADYHLHRMPPPYKLDIIRLYITPHAAFGPTRSTIPRRAKYATDAGRVMYIALPDSCPNVYISLSGSSGSSGRAKGARDSKGRAMAKVDIAAMKKIVLEAIPKALSRPQERWALESTKLTARSLRSICELRGNQRPGTGGGAYSAFAGDSQTPNQSPVDVQIRKEVETRDERQILVEKRFGQMTGKRHAPLDRVHVKINNVIPKDLEGYSEWGEEQTGDIGLTFSGGDVFSGLKNLAQLEPGYVDLDKLPAWMTGELGVSSLAV
ncbi:uncharacterized protein Z518_06160 [Rhinocladiella mackenziei CBS 650.93]|uniref:CHL4 family chromosome segregation protein n=1 Tax=Rhinocladiella mackenziei CBS 650.93 TaxID=1442369 RepID=A0A0D2H4E1_9EURO|nr:uncharacterized protein Z518_06160 [Rhinocladiella mackenziei CBS 650.93]KIX05288.1 hypothetical protein Z518_06160 [Rhinocladiella mackenziei CBS 650.93]